MESAAEPSDNERHDGGDAASEGEDLDSGQLASGSAAPSSLGSKRAPWARDSNAKKARAPEPQEDSEFMRKLRQLEKDRDDLREAAQLRGDEQDAQFVTFRDNVKTEAAYLLHHVGALQT